MTDLRYPIGKFESPKVISDQMRSQFLQQIAETPSKLRLAVKGLNEQQIDTPYRAEGWTVRQVVHHIPDSHMNAYIRTKLALTESEPTIKPYHEDLWAQLYDGKTAPIECSLTLTESLHERWLVLLRSLTPKDFTCTFRHPERGLMTIDSLVALYAWHGCHHVAHITSLRDRMGW
jgi:uncharacterized damage-inducible protein DinB